MSDLKKYISIEQSACPDTWDVWFDSAAAFRDGAILRRPLTPRESAYHFELITDAGNDMRKKCGLPVGTAGTYQVDDEAFSVFESRAAAEKMCIAATIAYHSGE